MNVMNIMCNLGNIDVLEICRPQNCGIVLAETTLKIKIQGV